MGKQFELPELPYSFDALEPHIDAKTMEIHHDKHHAGYVAKLNAALEGHDDLMEMTVEEILTDISKVPDDVRQAVINNGGGHANHSLFWEVISPKGGGSADFIAESFGSMDKFKEEFSNAAATRFGSGWAWLVKSGDDLKVMSTANQDSPLLEGMTPLLGLDVWEHAYYLNYQNRRPDYIEAWWNVVNWDKVSELYDDA